MLVWFVHENVFWGLFRPLRRRRRDICVNIGKGGYAIGCVECLSLYTFLTYKLFMSVMWMHDVILLAFCIMKNYYVTQEGCLWRWPVFVRYINSRGRNVYITVICVWSCLIACWLGFRIQLGDRHTLLVANYLCPFHWLKKLSQILLSA